jgi:hypothetical protein
VRQIFDNALVYEDLYNSPLDTVPWDVAGNGAAGLSILTNPFSQGTTIRYRVPREGDVSLSLYRPDGTLARLLTQGPATAGPHDVAWDGSDGEGRPLPAGVYYCRLSGDGVEATSRVVRIK